MLNNFPKTSKQGQKTGTEAKPLELLTPKAMDFIISQ